MPCPPNRRSGFAQPTTRTRTLRNSRGRAAEERLLGRSCGDGMGEKPARGRGLPAGALRPWRAIVRWVNNDPETGGLRCPWFVDILSSRFFLRPLAAIELMHAWANGVKCTVSGLLNLSRG
jgi:hypothetical protein